MIRVTTYIHGYGIPRPVSSNMAGKFGHEQGHEAFVRENPSEKYESQFGLSFPIEGNHVPSHQPVYVSPMITSIMAIHDH